MCQNSGDAGPSVVQVVAQLRRALLEDVQHLEHGEPLRLRRRLVDVVALVLASRSASTHSDRNELRSDIVIAAAARLHPLDDRAADRPAVERVRPALGQQLVGAREVRVAEDAVQRRRLAVAQEHGGGLGVLAQHVDVELSQLPSRRGSARSARTPAGQPSIDGSQHLRERHAPEAVRAAGPAVDRAGHGRAVHPVERHLVRPALVEVLGRPRARAPSRRRSGRTASGPSPSSRSPPCRRRCRRSRGSISPSIAAVATAASAALPPSRASPARPARPAAGWSRPSPWRASTSERVCSVHAHSRSPRTASMLRPGSVTSAVAPWARERPERAVPM